MLFISQKKFELRSEAEFAASRCALIFLERQHCVVMSEMKHPSHLFVIISATNYTSVNHKMGVWRHIIRARRSYEKEMR